MSDHGMLQGTEEREGKEKAASGISFREDRSYWQEDQQTSLNTQEHQESLVCLSSPRFSKRTEIFVHVSDMSAAYKADGTMAVAQYQVWQFWTWENALWRTVFLLYDGQRTWTRTRDISGENVYNHCSALSFYIFRFQNLRKCQL